MVEMISVRLSVSQIRLLAQVTEIAAIEEGRHAQATNSNKAKEQYLQRSARLNELAELFKTTCP